MKWLQMAVIVLLGLLTGLLLSLFLRPGAPFLFLLKASWLVLVFAIAAFLTTSTRWKRLDLVVKLVLFIVAILTRMWNPWLHLDSALWVGMSSLALILTLIGRAVERRRYRQAVEEHGAQHSQPATTQQVEPTSPPVNPAPQPDPHQVYG